MAVGDTNLERDPLDIGQAWAWAREWTGLTYRTYWFHHFWYEAPRSSIRFYLPAIIGTLIRPIVNSTARESMTRTLASVRARFS